MRERVREDGMEHFCLVLWCGLPLQIGPSSMSHEQTQIMLNNLFKQKFGWFPFLTIKEIYNRRLQQ